MRRYLVCLAFLLSAVLLPWTHLRSDEPAAGLQAGFGEADVTPDIGQKPVYMAGFGKNRKATAVHDPIMVRTIVLGDGKSKIALVSVDVVGLFHSVTEQVRKQLPGFSYVVVSSTHNHEGPDTLGLWGPNSLQSGVDPQYMKKIVAAVVGAVRQADKSRTSVQAHIGKANAPELLHDGREPIVKHDELVALQFLQGTRSAGILVQWNCHPETLGGQNTEISADFIAQTVGYLKTKYRCPVIYLTGTVGGLMTSLHVPVKDKNGAALEDGTFAKTDQYGRLVGELAEKALSAGKEVKLVSIEARTSLVYLPMDNAFYHLGWRLGVLDRQAFAWTGDPTRAEPVRDKGGAKGKMCIQTEVGYLRLGDLEVAAIPGEIYPELVLGKVQDPADPGADFPNAPIEPSIYGQLKAPHRMLIGLAGDEIGYIIPKRQWDEKPPFCYGRKSAQYGEVNSLGPETAPLLCEAFRKLVKK